MNELIQVAFSPVNIVYTFLLILVVVYWLSIIIGVLDFGSFDLDFDIEADVDVDTDIEVSGAGALAGFLHFFNFGKLPFMILMSFVILSSWSISVLMNHYFGNDSILFPIALAAPNIFISLCFAKVITLPLIPVFKNLDTSATPVDYIGMTGKLLMPASSSKMGQAEVLLEDSPLLINVKLESENAEKLKKGDEIVILRKKKNQQYYIIKKLSDEIK